MYDSIISQCKCIFDKKVLDYGLSYKALRLPSITDQILIKVMKVRTTDEDSVPEMMGVINYCVIALMEIRATGYDAVIDEVKDLMAKKNDQYGGSHELMRLPSIIDIILQKVYRIRNIEDNNGVTIVSEGVDAGYIDIINYAIFYLMRGK